MASNMAGDNVQPMGTPPRSALPHSLRIKCSMYCRLSPSLKIKATYILFCNTGLGGAGLSVTVLDVPLCTVKLLHQSLAMVVIPYCEVRCTPGCSSGHQPMKLEPAGMEARKLFSNVLSA